MPWWTPQNHADRRPLLLKRGRLKQAIRTHFEGQGFIEVECGALHAPEFTMLEWYRAAEDYQTVITDSLAMVKLAADVMETDRFSYRGAQCDPRSQADRLTVAQAFTHFAGIDLMATLSPAG